MATAPQAVTLESIAADMKTAKETAEKLAEKYGVIDQKFDERLKAIESKIDEKASERITALEKRLVDINGMPLGTAASKQAELDTFVKSVLQRKAVPQGQSMTDGDGGYVVPDTLLPEILNRLFQNGAIRPRATVVPVVGDTIKYNTKSTGVAVYWKGEGVAPDVAKLTLNQGSVSIKKMIGLGAITRELNMNAPGFSNFVLDEFRYAVNREEDRVLINGNTAATPTADPYMGILYAANVAATGLASGHTSVSKLDCDDLLNALVNVDPEVYDGAEWGFSHTAMPYIRGMKEATTGALMFAPMTDAMPATLFGYPLNFYSQLPTTSSVGVSTAFGFFGNLKRGVRIFDRQNVIIELSKDAAFTTDEILVKITWLGGYLVAPLAGQITKFVTAAS